MGIEAKGWSFPILDLLFGGLLDKDLRTSKQGSDMWFVLSDLPLEVRAFGGHFALTSARIMDLDQGSLLYLTGYGFVDNSCCGVGGCSYALVLGWVEEKRTVALEQNSLKTPLESEVSGTRTPGLTPFEPKGRGAEEIFGAGPCPQEVVFKVRTVKDLSARKFLQGLLKEKENIGQVVFQDD